MNRQNPHIDDHSRFFKEKQIPYSRSKEDVWNDMMDRIQEQKGHQSTGKMLRIYWSAAAVMVLLIGLAAFMRFYSTSFNAPPGQHLSTTLPDGSRVHLNAGTHLSYHPYWWQFARILELEGEAFFEVEEGNRFTVRSSHRYTQVLGTSFNIYARDDVYRVHCLTGQVEVKTGTGELKILEPNQSVIVSDRTETKVQTGIQSEHAISWTNNRFIYTAAPMNEVFTEMERQFDITVEIDPGIEGEYTGNFMRGESPETILRMIARPFGLTVEQIHQTKYRITKGEN
ncbi:MAG: FecR family protein [Bacteroidales bacterium]